MDIKIKLLVFDLDGVLVDSRPLHYEALNHALAEVNPKYIITPAEHQSKYDGNTTTTKLKMLTHDKGLPVQYYDQIWKRKQDITQELIKARVQKDDRLIELFIRLKCMGYTLYCASNAIWITVRDVLLRKGIIEFFDYFLSNEDIKNPKPNPDIYITSISRAKVSPKETLIMEDSDIGKKAAVLSGAHLCPIIDPEDLTLEKILTFVRMAEKDNEQTKLDMIAEARKLNIVIPMAGAGSRFANSGYAFPKPLIPVHGKPMIEVVVRNLNLKGKYIFIVQKKHVEQYQLRYMLPLIAPDCEIVETDGLTEGAVCSVLLARHLIDKPDESLVIANSDQFVEYSSSQFLYQSLSEGVDGSIQVFESTHPKWSFVKLDQEGFVSEVAEKRPISNLASTGIYFWRRGSDFCKYADQMIEKNLRVNGEFFVCPVFNEAIADGKKFKTISATRMWGIGIPSDLEYFLSNYKGSI